MTLSAVEPLERSLRLGLYILSVAAEPLPLTLEPLKATAGELDLLFERDEAPPRLLVKAPRLFIARLELIEELAREELKGRIISEPRDDALELLIEVSEESSVLSKMMRLGGEARGRRMLRRMLELRDGASA